MINYEKYRDQLKYLFLNGIPARVKRSNGELCKCSKGCTLYEEINPKPCDPITAKWLNAKCEEPADEITGVKTTPVRLENWKNI